MKPEINALEVLDRMDEFRRNHQNDRQHPSDWAMRCMEAIVAQAAGYESRIDWTDALKANPDSSYAKYING